MQLQREKIIYKVLFSGHMVELTKKFLILFSLNTKLGHPFNELYIKIIFLADTLYLAAHLGNLLRHFCLYLRYLLLFSLAGFVEVLELREIPQLRETRFD